MLFRENIIRKINEYSLWRASTLNKNEIKIFAMLMILALPLIFSPTMSTPVKESNITFPIQVLFDESHNQIYTSQDFNEFINALELDLGFTVTVNTDSNLTISSLENYDIVIIPIPGVNFSVEEINAIATFVSDWGRSLLLLGDSNSNVAYLNSLTSSFGFKFVNGTVFRLGSSEVEIIEDMFQNNSLTYNIESLTYIGCGLNVFKISSVDFYNYKVIWGDEDTFLDLNGNGELDADELSDENVTMVIGTEVNSGGRIIAIGSSKMLTNTYWSSRSNTMFVFNVMKWLAKFPQPYLEEVYISWIISCQWLKDPNNTAKYGGFATDPRSDSVSMLSTYSAIRFLNDTNSLDKITNVSALVKFVKDSQYLANPADERYGGFSGYPGDIDIECGYTGMAIYILKVLNKLDVINLTAAIQFLASHQKLDDPEDIRNYGGFSRSTSVNATFEETYWAVYGLYLTGSLSEINIDTCIQWIVSCQYLENSSHVNYGAFLAYPGKSPDDTYMLYSYLGVLTLRLLDRLNDITDSSALISWVKSLYNSSSQLPEYYGGFFDHPGGMVTASSTYMGAIILLTFNVTFDKAAVIDYLSKCQNLDGGFGDGVTVGAITSTLGGYYGAMGDPSISVKGFEQFKLGLRAIVSIPGKIYSGDQVYIDVHVTDLQNKDVSDILVKAYINGSLIGSESTNQSGLCTFVWTTDTPGTYVLYVETSGGKYYANVTVEGIFEVLGRFDVLVEGLPEVTFVGENLSVTVVVKDALSNDPINDANVTIIFANTTYTLQSIGNGYYQLNLTTLKLPGEVSVKIIVERKHYETWEQTFTLIVYPRPLPLWMLLLIIIAIIGVISGIIIYVRRRRRIRMPELTLPTP